MTSTSVSVVIPHRPGFAPALGELERLLQGTGLTFEVAQTAGEDFGAAIRKGVSEAKGNVIVVVDPALPYPVAAIGDAVAMVESGTTDVVFASTRAQASVASISPASA